MQKLNDLSRSLAPLEPDGTLIAVIEMSSRVQWKAAASARWHEPYDARVSIRFCERLGGEIPRAYSAKPKVTALQHTCELMHATKYISVR